MWCGYTVADFGRRAQIEVKPFQPSGSYQRQHEYDPCHFHVCSNSSIASGKQTHLSYMIMPHAHVHVAVHMLRVMCMTSLWFISRNFVSLDSLVIRSAAADLIRCKYIVLRICFFSRPPSLVSESAEHLWLLLEWKRSGSQSKD